MSPEFSALARVKARAAGLLAVGLVAVGLLTGCGYQMAGGTPSGGYQWSSLYRGDVSTVSVPIFTNRTFYRGVEFDLTKALAGQIEASTPYKVSPRDRADTVLEGEVVNVRVRTISNNQFTAIPQEQLYEVRVNFTWKDLRTGRILVTRRDFQQTAPYYPTLGEGQFAGRQQNLERLALGIVQEMQADW